MGQWIQVHGKKFFGETNFELFFNLNDANFLTWYIFFVLFHVIPVFEHSSMTLRDESFLIFFCSLRNDTTLTHDFTIFGAMLKIHFANDLSKHFVDICAMLGTGLYKWTVPDLSQSLKLEKNYNKVGNTELNNDLFCYNESPLSYSKLTKASSLY